MGKLGVTCKAKALGGSWKGNSPITLESSLSNRCVLPDSAGAQKCKAGSTELKSRHLQAAFLSAGSKGEAISLPLWLLAEFCSLRLKGHGSHFLQLSAEGCSEVLEATHIPWLMALLPHPQSQHL